MKNELPLAVVMDISETGYGVVQSLSKLDIPIIGFHTSKYKPIGKDSNLVKMNVISQNISDEEKVKKLLDLGVEEKFKPVLIPASDVDVAFLSKYGEVLSKNFILPESSKYSLENVLNKDVMKEIAIKSGLNVPETIFFNSKSNYSELDNFPLPAIIKPSNSLLGYKEHMNVVYSENDLIDTIKNTIPNCESIIISKYVEGDSGVFEGAGYIDNLTGNPVITSVVEKRRQFPTLQFGSGTFVDTNWNDSVKEYTKNFIKELDFKNGSMHLEYKLDSRSGKLYFIEANYRPSSLQKISDTAGMNTVLFSYLNSIGENFNLPNIGQKNAHWVDELRDWRTVFLDSISVDDILNSYKTVDSFSLYDNRDEHIYEREKKLLKDSLHGNEKEIFLELTKNLEYRLR